MSGSVLVDLLILLAVLAIVVVAAWYILQQVALPEPIRKIVMIVLVALVAIVAVIVLLNMRGGGGLKLSSAEFVLLPSMV